MNANVFLAMIHLYSGVSDPQLQPPRQPEMERTLSPYWSSDSVIAVARRKSDSVEALILQNHERTLPASNTEKAIRVRQELEQIADRSLGTTHGYRRVTCSIVSCEVILVVPDVDSDGPVARSIVKSFYDDTHRENDRFLSTTPSMVTEGSNTDKGFSMLHYVNIR